MSTDPHTVEMPRAMPETFARQGYVVRPGLVQGALLNFLHVYAHTRFKGRLMAAGDPQVPGAPNLYGDPAVDGLLEYLRPYIEKFVGLQLHSTYSYFRVYRSGDTLARHRDRAACEVSVSLNVGQIPADPWPIHIEGRMGPYAASLLPGDALIYRGMDCFHWRERFEGSHLVQMFLHYVDANGPHAGEKFDGRQSLMRPAIVKDKQHQGGGSEPDEP
jgi:hypothetical protein